jgi:hypothetical protein
MLEKFLSLSLLSFDVNRRRRDTMMQDLLPLNQHADYPGIKTDRIGEG